MPDGIQAIFDAIPTSIRYIKGQYARGGQPNILTIEKLMMEIE